MTAKPIPSIFTASTLAALSVGVAAMLGAAAAGAHEGEPDHDHGAPAAAPPAPASAPPPDDPNITPDPGPAPAAAPVPHAPGPAVVAGPKPAPHQRPAGEEDTPRARQRTISDSNWRTRSRRPSKAQNSDWFQPTHFVAELRFAPYFWQVSDSEGLTYPEGLDTSGIDPSTDAFTYFFGDPTSFYFGMEVDWLPLHIPYVGSLGAGFGWGWASVSGPARTSTGQQVEAETSLTTFPLHLSAVVRIDGPLRKWGFPVVPHAKLGFGVAPWDASTDGNDDGVGSTSAGIHFAAGGSLALNAFDPTAARTMYEDTGIHYAYLWAEWMFSDMGGIGNAGQLRVGTSTVAMGLALDF